MENLFGEFMTPQPLVTASVGIGLDAAKALLQQYRIEKLPLVDDEGILKGLITVKDIQKARRFSTTRRWIAKGGCWSVPQ